MLRNLGLEETISSNINQLITFITLSISDIKPYLTVKL